LLKLVWPRRGYRRPQPLGLYQEFRRGVCREGAVPFFAEQVATRQSDLRAAEEELARFEATHQIVLLTKQKEVALSRIAVVEGQLAEAETRLDEASAKLVRFRATTAGPTPDFGVLGEFDQESFPAKIMVELAMLS
jgi:hypothetical protein